jgi:hypothetical protein
MCDADHPAAGPDLGKSIMAADLGACQRGPAYQPEGRAMTPPRPPIRPDRSSSARLSAAVTSVVLALAQPRPARADGGITTEYQDYRESGGRIDVRTEGTQAAQDIGTDLHIAVGGVIDTIAGATPTGQPAPTGSTQVVLSELHDRRKAWDADFSAQLSRVNVEVGYARSLEHDYVSNGWSVNTLTTFNQKNTTLLAGVAGTDDTVEVYFLPEWLKKRSNEAIVGITQLLDPLTSVTLDLTGTRVTGMLNEPYKVVQKDIQVLPGLYLPETFAEDRPDQRNRGTALLSVDRAVPAAHGSLEASYRYYRDSYGISAHTVGATWFQKLGDTVILEPGIRLYAQTAAGFYYYNLDATAIVPTQIPLPHGPNYSSDARLSALSSVDYGIKATWTATGWLRLTAAIDGYDQHGTDGVTPQSAYYRASVTSLSAGFSW